MTEIVLPETFRLRPYRGPFPIALCGRPGSGKSTVQAILAEEFGVEPRDDGRYIRDVALRVFGLAEADVSTQEGKLREVALACGAKSVRQVLGEIGLTLEKIGGEFLTPEIALRDAETSTAPAVSFGSVRMRQGAVYKAAGGMVVEIVRPGVPPSPHAFDAYAEDLVDVRIVNDNTISDLRRLVARTLTARLNGSHAV